MSLVPTWEFLKKVFKNWEQDRISSQAAALSYYTIFSFVPLLLISIFIVSMIFGENAARTHILNQVSGLLGIESGLKIQEIVQNANKPTFDSITKILSFIGLLFIASGVFNEIQEGLNMIWGVKTNPVLGWYIQLKNRLLAFIMVLVLACLLLISLVLSELSSYISLFFEINFLTEFILGHSLALVINTILFAAVFKVLPDVELNWQDVWVGAIITSVLFGIGKILIRIYLYEFPIYSIFGAAGFLIIILIWVFYSAQIFFIGAEITKIFFMSKGKKVMPKKNAILKKH